MEWSESTSALNDMLRSEIVQQWINDANREYTRHRASAGQFAAAGNHAAALAEINVANEYRRVAAYWEQQLQEAQ